MKVMNEYHEMAPMAQIAAPKIVQTTESKYEAYMKYQKEHEHKKTTLKKLLGEAKPLFNKLSEAKEAAVAVTAEPKDAKATVKQFNHY